MHLRRFSFLEEGVSHLGKKKRKLFLPLRFRSFLILTNINLLLLLLLLLLAVVAAAEM